MIVIDLYGLPGCGKSTIAKELYQKLSANCQVEFFNKNEYIQEGARKKSLIKDYMRCFLPKNIKFWITTISKTGKINHEVILKQNFKERIWGKLRLVLLYDKLTSNKNKANIVIVDQGIVQDFSAVNLYKENTLEIVQKYIQEYLNSSNQFLFINCKMTIEKSVERTNRRGRKDYSFDQLPDDKRRKFVELQNVQLEKFNKVLKYIKNYLCVECEKDFTQEDLDEITKRIIEKINEV